MTSNGSRYRGRNNYRFKQCKGLQNCPVRIRCTMAEQNGKIVQHIEFTPYIEANARRVAEDPETYKKRQALVEHPFGTMKRRSGFDHIITKKGIPAASADFGLTASAYNLKRLINLGWKANTGPKQFLDLPKT